MPQNETAADRSWAWILWAALCVALSPVWVDAANLALEEWWARGSALVAALALVGMWTWDGPRRRVRGGAWLVALGVAIALVATAGGMPRLGRPAVPLAVLGMALALGRPAPRRAGLLFFAVAPPRALMDRLPGLHDLADRFVPETLVLTSPDGGLPLLLLCAGLGAYAAIRRDDPTPAIVRSAIRHGLLALPVQSAALLVAVGLARIDRPEVARSLLSHAVWIGTAVVLLARIHRRRDPR